MISTTTHLPLLSNSQTCFRSKNSPKHQLIFHFSTYPSLISLPSLHIFFSKPSIRLNSSQTSNSSLNQFLREFVPLLALSLVLLCLRLFSNTFLPHFDFRWRQLIDSSEQCEVQTRSYPPHLWQAIVAYEDRRFFGHFGIDPFGVARAVLSLSSRGGGSTITQQLVKNTFLRNERWLSRKFVEIVLALAVERALSKWRILSSYMCKIYWGHGIYGIESASFFYFGKHPSLLSLAESTMLAGMIPAPELRSPLRDCTRGKIFQCRVLKRMVEVGILDAHSARLVARQSINIHTDSDGPEYGNEFPVSSFSTQGLESSYKVTQGGRSSSMKNIWNWERESKIWEVLEDIDDWAIKQVSGNIASRSSINRGVWHKHSEGKS